MTAVDNFNIEEEIESIQAVFCQPGECQVTDAGSTKQITLQLKRTEVDDVTLILSLTESYPFSIPQLSLISSQLSRETVTSLKQNVELQAQHLIGQHMLLDVISLVQENLDDVVQTNANESKESKTDTSKETKFVWTSLLHLDHMRSKNKYIKTIEKWTTELGLTGRLIFMGRLILILLQGEQKDIKEYISRQRSVNIDVDSHGRSCKERMLSVLCEQKTPANKRFEAFSTVECKGLNEVEAIFYTSQLEDIYLSIVKDLQGKYF